MSVALCVQPPDDEVQHTQCSARVTGKSLRHHTTVSVTASHDTTIDLPGLTTHAFIRYSLGRMSGVDIGVICQRALFVHA